MLPPGIRVLSISNLRNRVKMTDCGLDWRCHSRSRLYTPQDNSYISCIIDESFAHCPKTVNLNKGDKRVSVERWPSGARRLSDV